MNVLDLFSGIGGFSLGLERAGMRTVAFCEIDPYCRAVLKKHWPNVPVFDDVRTLTAKVLADAAWYVRAEQAQGGTERKRIGERSQSIDLICGGFPCQDISVAGKGAGIEGSCSGLWSEYARIIGEVRPRWVIIENVSNLRSGYTLHERWPDRCLCGWNYRWRRVPLYNEAEEMVLSASGRGNGGQGFASASKTTSSIRRKPKSSSQENGKMGWSASVGADGEAIVAALEGMSAVSASEEGTSEFVAEFESDRCGDDSIIGFRIEPQGAIRIDGSGLVCPSCGRQVVDTPTESYRAYWLHRVLGDMAALGYDAEWHCIPASAVGAPHRRDRVWIVGYAGGEGLQGCFRSGDMELQGAEESLRPAWSSSPDMADADARRKLQPQGRISYEWGWLGDGSWWLIEPDVGRVAHGVPARVDRLRSLGNAVVPQIPEIIGRAIMAQHAEET